MGTAGLAGMSTVLGARGRLSFLSNSITGAGYLRRDLQLFLRLLGFGVDGGKRGGGLGVLAIVLYLFVWVV
jgi:hypothetical protein